MLLDPDPVAGTKLPVEVVVDQLHQLLADPRAAGAPTSATQAPPKILSRTLRRCADSGTNVLTQVSVASVMPKDRPNVTGLRQDTGPVQGHRSYHERYWAWTVWQTLLVQPSGVAILLAQVGAHATERFAARVGELGLTPAHVGVLRAVARRPGLSQQELAADLRVLPSKIVTLVDELEARGVIERHRGTADRRQYALQLSARAQHDLARVRQAVAAHDQDITAALTAPERKQLAALLSKVADAQGLAPGVHPGYRTSAARDPVPPVTRRRRTPGAVG